MINNSKDREPTTSAVQVELQSTVDLLPSLRILKPNIKVF